MALDDWMIYTAAEVILLLIILCLVLLFHAKGLKVAISALQQKLADALKDLKQARQQNRSNTENLAQILDTKLADTENFHASQKPDCSIAQDLTRNTPPARLVAAMRHRFLSAEKAAHESGADEWSALAEHYRPLVDLSAQPLEATIDNPATPAPDSLSYEEQRAEIDRFKRLFTTMEGQWRDAKHKAEDYYQELIRLIGDSNDPEQKALKAQAESELAHLNQQEVPTAIAQSLDNETLAHLKNENAQQREEIERLKIRLSEGDMSDQGALIQDLEQQLEKQLKLMRESEMCIELLEQEIAQLNQKLAKRPTTDAETPPHINELLNEKQQLSNKISQLEGENEQLVGLAEHAQAEQQKKLAHKDAEIGKLKKKLVQLLKLQQKNQ